MATRPTCGTLLILSPVVKHWGTLRRQGLCSHPPQLWVTCEFVGRCEVLGTPKVARVMWPHSPLVGHF